MTASTSGNDPRQGFRQVTNDRADAVAGEARLGPVIDIYARLSFAQNGQTVNVDDQILMGTEDIHARGGRVGEIFTDNSKSAWNRKVVRKDWIRLMERIETRQCDGMWVLNLDRFTRQPKEGERMVDAVEVATEAGRVVHIWARYSEYDLRTAEGRDNFRSAIQAAARESDRTSERTRNGKVRTRKAGLPHGGLRSWAMPGLIPVDPKSTDGKSSGERTPAWKGKRRQEREREYESDERINAERKIAAECVERLLADESLYSLTADLNSRGRAGERAALPVTGAGWTREGLRSTLCRPALAGLIAYEGEIVGKLADIEPVITEKQWRLVVAKMAARKTGRPPVATHMLTGTMRCGRCGTLVSPYVRERGSEYEDGERRRDYRCPSPKDTGKVGSKGGGCGRNVIDARLVENAVRYAVGARLRDPNRAELVAEEMRRAHSVRAALLERLEKIEAEADELSNKVATWGVKRVDKAMIPLTETIADLQAQLDALDDDNLTGLAVGDAVARWEQMCADGDVEAQRRMIRRIFPNLTVAPPERKMDNRVERLLWDGPRPGGPLA